MYFSILYWNTSSVLGPKNPTEERKPHLVFSLEQLIERVWSGVKILLLSVNFVFRSYMVLNGSLENQFSSLF